MTIEQRISQILGELQFQNILLLNQNEQLTTALAPSQDEVSALKDSASPQKD